MMIDAELIELAKLLARTAAAEDSRKRAKGSSDENSSVCKVQHRPPESAFDR